MRLSIFLFMVGLFLSLGLGAQAKLDLVLKEKLKDNKFSEGYQDFFVKGDESAVINWLVENDGKIKFISSAGMAIRLKGSKVKEMAGLRAVEQVYFNNYKGTPLNDHVIQNANVAGLQSDWEFDSTLSGKGVIIGFIDAGIDYTHGDFIDENGQSRILYIWDQNDPEDSTQIFEDYGYGRLITGDTLNNWLSNDVQIPLDPNSLFGHGSTVAGAACANGRALEAELEEGSVSSDLHGIAPESMIIMVSSDFSKGNWLATIADGVDFMLNKAEELNMPIVINLSVGTYLGSHDALDPVGLTINDWFSDEHPGRMLVCAGGNSGELRYHLGYQSTTDTSLSFFKASDALSEPGKGAFFELWLDTLDVTVFKTAVGLVDLSDLYRPSNTAFKTINDQIGSTLVDTLFEDTIALAIVTQFMEFRGDQVRVQIQVDSVMTDNLDIVYYTLGDGRVDCWSAEWLGTSDIIGPEQLESLPIEISEMYRAPDSLMQVVSSFSCAANVLTVGNYKNRTEYIDVNGSVQQFEGQVGQRTAGSSRGPTRDNRQKPDVSASGDLVLSSGAYNIVETLLSSAPDKVAQGGKHIRNGGTSMASPIVSGISALYLQHCPESFPSEISNSLTSTAFQDIFTGPLPNVKWGYGKINGLAAVNDGLYFVEIAGENMGQCNEGELELSIFGEFSTYLWSTGEMTSKICATSGDYWVKVSDESGCWSVSDPFTVLIQNIKEHGVVTPISVYPNPNNGAFIIENLDFHNDFKVSNILGIEVGYVKAWEGDDCEVYLLNAKSGIYFIRFLNTNKTVKIIVR